jgi:hypothetical protein
MSKPLVCCIIGEKGRQHLRKHMGEKRGATEEYVGGKL